MLRQRNYPGLHALAHAISTSPHTINSYYSSEIIYNMMAILLYLPKHAISPESDI